MLENNPIPIGAKKLLGTENLYRLRIGNYRVIYEVRKNKLIIYIIKIGHRKEIYKKISKK